MACARHVVANLESKKRVSGDALLYAVGRQGAVDELNLAAVGIETDSRGRIPVDEHYCTNVDHIYAVGDVVGFPSLASVSMEQGRLAASLNWFICFGRLRALLHSVSQGEVEKVKQAGVF